VPVEYAGFDPTRDSLEDIPRRRVAGRPSAMAPWKERSPITTARPPIPYLNGTTGVALSKAL